MTVIPMLLMRTRSLGELNSLAQGPDMLNPQTPAHCPPRPVQKHVTPALSPPSHQSLCLLHTPSRPMASFPSPGRNSGSSLPISPAGVAARWNPQTEAVSVSY